MIEQKVDAQRKKLLTVIWSLVVLVAGAAIVWEIRATRPAGDDKTFFTVDDGKTWFLGDLDQLPPFEHEGKEAVRCFVFQASNGKQFAGYLMKYTPQARASLEKASPQERDRRAADMSLAMFKQPGKTQWVSGGDRGAIDIIRSVVAPAGERDALPVNP